MASKPSLKLHGVVKKIESPLAKYNSSGQLTCAVCNTVIKSEMVWTAHVNGRQHRDKIASLKNNQPEPQFLKPHNPLAAKRKAEPEYSDISTSASPSKKGVPLGFFDNPTTKSTSSPPVLPIKSILKNSSRTQYHDLTERVTSTQSTSPIEEMETNQVSNMPSPPTTTTLGQIHNQPDVIPEGFFDDPKMDAKVRHIEYKDPVEEEWNKFQKEIMEEVSASVTIQEEDQEESTADRQLEEIEDQMLKWGRVLELEQKKDLYTQRVRALREAKMEDEESSSSDDETIEMDKFFDWRSKAT